MQDFAVLSFAAENVPLDPAKQNSNARQGWMKAARKRCTLFAVVGLAIGLKHSERDDEDVQAGQSEISDETPDGTRLFLPHRAEDHTFNGETLISIMNGLSVN